MYGDRIWWISISHSLLCLMYSDICWRCSRNLAGHPSTQAATKDS
jgi:hypothetical protein